MRANHMLMLINMLACACWIWNATPLGNAIAIMHAFAFLSALGSEMSSRRG